MHNQSDPIHPSRWPTNQAKRWLYAAAGLSVAAGLIHVIAAPSHFEEWIGYGLFFLIAATAQVLYALLLLIEKSNRELLFTGLLGNGLIIGLYLVTRTVGIPFFGPKAGEVEAVGALDAISKIIELALMICLVIGLRSLPASGSTTQPSSQ